MPYRFALERPDYSDLASGRVLYSAPGLPAFPIRLASEVLQRCLAWRATASLPGPCVLYDPCCGAGYLLTVLGFLHGPALRALIGSDIETGAVRVARQNLSLLSQNGLAARIEELADLSRRYGKSSHREALASAQRLRARLGADRPLATPVFQADALDGMALAAQFGGVRPDIVVVDVPYGRHSQWRVLQSDATDPLWALLEALLGVVGPTSLVAIASDKSQKAAHAAYTRLVHFQLGKRRVVLLKPVGA